MRRTILLGGVLPFVAAFLGGLLAVNVAPAAEAQDARVRAEQFTIVDGSGADRVRLQTGPGIAARVQLLAPDGTTQRVWLATGAPVFGGTVPESAGINLAALDGTEVGRLGTGNPNDPAPDGVNLLLSDRQRQNRIRLVVAADGTPSIELLDAEGNVTWSAR